MKSTIVEVRRRKLAIIIEQRGSIITEEIAKEFGVTTETVRKDLIVLQDRGLAIKCHGGAIAVSDEITTLSSKEREIVNQDIKQRIAEQAARFISNNTTIYLGPGSTVLYVAKILSDFSNLTIFTSSLAAADVLMGSPHKVFVLGGLVNEKNRSVCGSFGNDIIDKIAPSVAFMGCSGNEGFPGPTCGQFEEAETLKRTVEVANRSIVLCDSTKFTWPSLICYAKWNQIDTLITDSGILDETAKMLEQHTKVILADK